MLKSLCAFLFVLGLAASLAARCQEPCVTFLVPPEYPVLARMAGIQGAIRIRIRIDKEGRVTDAKAIPWEKNAYPELNRKTVESDYKVLSKAAIDNVTQWRFKPTEEPCDLTIEYDYRMEGRPSYYHRTKLRFHLPSKVEIIDNPPSPHP